MFHGKPCKFCIGLIKLSLSCTCSWLLFYSNKSNYKVQNPVHRDYSKCTHTYTHTYMSILTMKNRIYLQLKWTTNGDFRQRKTAVWNRKHGRSIVWGKEMSSGLTWRSPERASVREEGKCHSMQRGQRKGARTNGGKYGTRRLRAEAEQEGHHITNHQEARDVERGSTRRSSLKDHFQSDEHFNCFKGNNGGTSERQGGAYGLFWAHRYNLDLNCMHLWCWIHEQKFGSLFVLRQQLIYTCVQSHCYTYSQLLFYST